MKKDQLSWPDASTVLIIICFYDISLVRLCKFYFLFAKAAFVPDEKMERIILNNNAHQKPSILIPSINLAVSKIIAAFITKRKSPSVTIVMGSVRKISIGFIIAFKQASTNAKIIAVVKLAI